MAGYAMSILNAKPGLILAEKIIFKNQQVLMHQQLFTSVENQLVDFYSMHH